MFTAIKDFIRQRSREEWKEFFYDKWNDLRIWIQENGELAFILGIGIGILIIILFKIVMILVALAVISGFIGWNLSVPGENKSEKPS